MEDRPRDKPTGTPRNKRPRTMANKNNVSI
jgi:hypothetical protein